VEVPTKDEAVVAALLAERLGYVRRGLPDRVALVDAELARYGHTVAESKGVTDGSPRRARDRRSYEPYPSRLAGR
jgi:hypothetical protein